MDFLPPTIAKFLPGGTVKESWLRIRWPWMYSKVTWSKVISAVSAVTKHQGGFIQCQNSEKQGFCHFLGLIFVIKWRTRKVGKFWLFKGNKTNAFFYQTSTVPCKKSLRPKSDNFTKFAIK